MLGEETFGLRRDTKPLKRKKGESPAPARHVPWPEVLEHHIALIEAHTKMLESIQQQTAQGTGNHDAISNLVNRSYEMFRQAKDISRFLISATGGREATSIGSTPDSMNPGHNPAFLQRNAAQFVVRQGRENTTLTEAMEGNSTDGDVAAWGRVDIKTVKATSAPAPPVDNPYFVIDTEPTPVANTTAKRIAEVDENATNGHKRSKKERRSGEAEVQPLVETEDITAEVDARLKAKHKKQAKRRRESTEDESKIVKKRKKDKRNKRQGNDEIHEGEGQKKRRKRHFG